MPSNGTPHLDRGLGLLQATSLNLSNMVGIGPFITIPGFIAAMNGPHALIAWVAAAVLVICDGLVWSELGAALPGSGGTYHFLRETFGRTNSWWGRLMPFLFIWQFLVSGTLELASGYIGAAPYVLYMFPVFQSQNTSGGLPLGVKCMAAGCAIAVTLALCRRTRVVGWVSVVLVAGTLLTVLTVIVSGLMHFDYRLLTWPADVFGPKATRSPLAGLGGAMTIAIYDYLGYYNVCHLGEEVRDPGRTIPRAVLISVVLIAVLYLTMNTAIIAVVPWQEAMKSQTIAADFMERLFGRPVAVTFTALILWSVVACVFAMTLGYSRIPFAAARNGDFFPVFGQLDARGHYPTWSLLALGGLTAVFCFLPLQVVIDAAVTVRILIQFVAQIAALDWLRRKRPDVALPFRMKLYPLPSLIALCGWFFVFGSSNLKTRVAALAVVLSGVIVFAVWQALSRRHSGAGLAK